MQTASSRIWTLVDNSISYHDNHYTKCQYVTNLYVFAQPLYYEQVNFQSTACLNSVFPSSRLVA